MYFHFALVMSFSSVSTFYFHLAQFFGPLLYVFFGCVILLFYGWYPLLFNIFYFLLVGPVPLSTLTLKTTTCF